MKWREINVRAVVSIEEWGGKDVLDVLASTLPDLVDALSRPYNPRL